MGNIFSITQACIKSGMQIIVSSEPSEIKKADAILIPGVGAFPHAMNKLISHGVVDALDDFKNTGKSLIGICLGMQLLFEKSSEFEDSKGLGYIPGEVIHFKSFFDRNDIQSEMIRFPHTGWSRVCPAQEHHSQDNKRKLIWEATGYKDMYFIHSFVAVPEDHEGVLTRSNFGGLDFCSSVQKDNVFGFQFHPEKSGRNGLMLCKQLNTIIQLN